MMEKRITVLGSTGSLGSQTLEVAAFYENVKIAALAARSSVDVLEKQARAFLPDIAVMEDEKAALELKHRLRGLPVEVLAGAEGVLLAAGHKADMVFNCLVGAAGLMPSLRALEGGMDLALANKESLVIAGEMVMALAKKRGLKILPVDGEHSAIFQCLQGNEGNEVTKIYLTASGGPFRGFRPNQLTDIKAKDALNHPVWNMGGRITIDSATLMNKGFEIIEAVHLLDVPIDKVEALVHPQGIIHSMVEFADGAVMAQLSEPDMRLPVSYALNYPKRLEGPAKRTDFGAIGALTFEPPDIETFPCLRLAVEAFKAGGTATAVLNAADEAAVELFLADKIRFTDIPVLIEKALLAYTVKSNPSVAEIMEADAWARNFIKRLL